VIRALLMQHRRGALLVVLSASVLIMGDALAACGSDDPALATEDASAPDAAAPDAAPVDAAEPTRDAGDDGDGGPIVGEPRTRFVLLGDFGFDNADELAVANLVDAWKPDFIVTLGDNSYPVSNPTTIDETIGKYYASYISPYVGKYGPGSATPRFFACLGNHDWDTGSVKAHEDYFVLPNNERYWDLQKGPFQIFCLDSDTREPDGTASTSAQGTWLKGKLGSATAPFRLVVAHHPPYSSGQHGSQPYMQWPFREWGASAVYAGHDHGYERFDFGPGAIPYVVQGTGGADLRPFAVSQAGSVLRYNEKHGATFVEADSRYAVLSAVTFARDRVDEHVLVAPAEASRPTDMLLSSGGAFRYLDVGAPPAGWEKPSFDASAWKTGAAPLGYGQGGEGTVISAQVSHYFVGRFTVADAKVYDHAVVWLHRDDGAAVYVNGVEVGRSNLPEGAGRLHGRERVGAVRRPAAAPRHRRQRRRRRAPPGERGELRRGARRAGRGQALSRCWRGSRSSKAFPRGHERRSRRSRRRARSTSGRRSSRRASPRRPSTS
jgi:tartrate-resistant acid phosphatase type 5